MKSKSLGAHPAPALGRMSTFSLFFCNATQPSSSRFTVRTQGPARIIKPGVDFHLIVTFAAKTAHVGRYDARVELTFEDAETDQRFTISRSLRANVGDLADHDLLRPSAPYTPPKRSTRPLWKDVVWGERPPRFIRNPYVVKIGPYYIPKDLANALSDELQDIGGILERLPEAYGAQTLAKANYVKVMSALLWIEEHRAKFVFVHGLWETCPAHGLPV